MSSPERDVRPAPARIPAHPSITTDQISLLVDRFYDRIRLHPRLGPIFDNRIGADWPAHLQKMKLFWSSVLLRNGVYKGKPVPAHVRMTEVEPEDFKDWLETFRPVANDVFETDAAPIVIEAAERVAQSLWLAMFGHAAGSPPAWMRHRCG